LDYWLNGHNAIEYCIELTSAKIAIQGQRYSEANQKMIDE
jgi:hypothetical protein